MFLLFISNKLKTLTKELRKKKRKESLSEIFWILEKANWENRFKS